MTPEEMEMFESYSVEDMRPADPTLPGELGYLETMAGILEGCHVATMFFLQARSDPLQGPWTDEDEARLVRVKRGVRFGMDAILQLALKEGRDPDSFLQLYLPQPGASPRA